MEQEHHGDAGVEERTVVRHEDEGERRGQFEEGAHVRHDVTEERGPKIVGIVFEEFFAEGRDFQERVVRGHDRNDVGKGGRELRDAGPEPYGQLDPLRGADPLFASEQEGRDDGEVVLAPAGEKDDAVAERAERQQRDDRDEVGRRQFGLDERAEQREDEGGIERDVEPGAARTADDGCAGEKREFRRAGAKVMERGGERRPELQAERAAHATHTERLEGEGPEEGFLKGRGLKCPGREVAPVEAGCEVAEEDPSSEERGDFDRVEEVGGQRIGEPFDDVLAAADLEFLREVFLVPGFRLEGRDGCGVRGCAYGGHQIVLRLELVCAAPSDIAIRIGKLIAA